MVGPERTHDPRVDQARCIGCGLCPDMMEEVFRLPDPRGRAYVHDEEGWKAGKEELRRSTAENCLVGAIHIDPRIGE